MLVTGGIMSAATVFRTGIGCAELLARRAPALMQLNVQTQAGSGDGQPPRRASATS